jgi:hypothetical protein
MTSLKGTRTAPESALAIETHEQQFSPVTEAAAVAAYVFAASVRKARLGDSLTSAQNFPVIAMVSEN